MPLGISSRLSRIEWSLGLRAKGSWAGLERAGHIMGYQKIIIIK